MLMNHALLMRLSFSLALAADVVLGYVTWTPCYSHWVPWPGFTFTLQAWQHHTHTFCHSCSTLCPATCSGVCLARCISPYETHELEIDGIPLACSFMQNSGPKVHPNIMPPVVRRHCAFEVGLNCGFWLADVFQFISKPFKELQTFCKCGFGRDAQRKNVVARLNDHFFHVMASNWNNSQYYKSVVKKIKHIKTVFYSINATG